MVPLPKKHGAKRCGEYRTISLISHASKVMINVLKSRIGGKVEASLGDDQFGFRKGLGTRDAIAALSILSERAMEFNQEVLVAFIDYEKAFDRVEWSKLMEIMKDIGIGWKERRLIQNLYENQKVVIQTQVGDSNPCRISRGVRQGCPLSSLLFNIYVDRIVKEALEESNLGIRVGGNHVPTLRYADDTVLIEKDEVGLQSLIEKVDRVGQKYGMRINAGKTKVMRIARKNNKPLQIQVGDRVLEEVKEFKYLGSIVTNDGSAERDVRTRIGIAKGAFCKMVVLQARGVSLELRQRLLRAYIWSVVLYGSEAWTLKKGECKRLEAFEMWTYRKMMGISWRDKVSNRTVLERMGYQSCQIIDVIKKRKVDWLRQVLGRKSPLVQNIIEGRMEGKRGPGRKRIGRLDSLKVQKSYSELKQEIICCEQNRRKN